VARRDSQRASGERRVTRALAPSTLFVADSDFGALGTIMYLLHGQPLAERATVMLPPEAFALHAEGLPVKCLPYRCDTDILEAARAQDAEVVCLYSGYLMAFHGVFRLRRQSHSPGVLRRLIATLRKEGRHVATSDPYLGTFRVMMDVDLPGRRRALEQLLVRSPANRVPGAAWLARVARGYEEANWRRLIGSVADELAGCVHLYPVPVPPGGLPHASFFNARYFNAPAAAASAPDPGRRPSWLFVLATFDLTYLETKYGREGFISKVAAKLREALAEGRDATFIGPAAVCADLAARLPEAPGLTLLSRCSFTEFERRLLGAEVAFYWQIFSTSAFMRLWSGLPVYFFDSGHNAHILKPLYEVGVARYYVAGEPRYLDMAQPLEADALEGRRASFEEEARASRAILERLPGPGEMVSRIALAGAAQPSEGSLRSPAPPPAR
jgi:hypothetical protein